MCRLRRDKNFQLVGCACVAIGRHRGVESEFRSAKRTVEVEFSVDDQQRPAGEEADHAGAVELVKNSGDDLIPQFAADAGVNLGFPHVGRGGVVRGLDCAGSALPGTVVEAPAEALHGNGRDGDFDAVVDGCGQPGLDAPHAEADHPDP